MTGDGYGQISFWPGPPRKIGAHVAAYMVANGLSTPPTLRVLHTCDAPACCNPAHLWLGTPRDNTRDMFYKQRDQFSRAQKAEIDRLRALLRAAGIDPDQP